MSLTTAQKIDVGNISSVLVSNFLHSGKVIRDTPKRDHPILTFGVRQALEWMYAYDPTNDDLELIGNYLISICYAEPKAERILNIGGGGAVSPITPGSSNLFPFYIHSSNFESDGKTYLNSRIGGVNIALFIDEGSQQFFPSTNFTYVAGGGFTITADWFDATQFDYTVRVERYFPIPT